jgi:hypothetical protein
VTEEPPEGSYLASRYYDPHRRREVWRVYNEDGRVEAFDGEAWWTVCTFSFDQVERAKRAIRESGLLDAADVREADAYDVAYLTYAWRLDGVTGSVTSWSYPAATVPAFGAVDERLDALETEAGAEWSRL